MRFKDFIQERAMNSVAFADVATRYGKIARVGYEFEMIVPTHSGLYVESDKKQYPAANSEPIQRYDTVSEFEEYFIMTSRKKRAILEAIDGWLDERKMDYVESHWESYVRGEMDEAEARDLAEYEYDRNNKNTDETDWFRSEYPIRKKFVDEFDLEPIFGWFDESDRHAAVYTEEYFEVEDDEEIVSSAPGVAQSLSAIIGSEPSILVSRHEEEKSTTRWYIEPDSSIKGDNPGDQGLELVSPPEPLEKALVSLKDIFAWMKKNNLETNMTTGLHINISVPDVRNKLDPLKLVVFMGERHAAELFNRDKNSTAKSQLEVVIKKIMFDGRLPDSADDLIKRSWSYLNSTKYFSVNFSTLIKGYLEFRLAGGENYHYDFKTASETVLRFVSALELACDPSLERREYIKKLSKIMGKASDAAANTVRMDAGKVSQELRRIHSLNQDIGQYFDRFNNSSGNYQKVNFIALLNSIVVTLKNFKTELTLKERVYLKSLASKSDVTSATIDSLEQDALSRQRIKKFIGL